MNKITFVMTLEVLLFVECILDYFHEMSFKKSRDVINLSSIINSFSNYYAIKRLSSYFCISLTFLTKSNCLAIKIYNHNSIRISNVAETKVKALV